ncbi:MAG TPA: nucleoside-diphosphate kinase [Thermoleophilia bacterium]|nr:nucleoside-diphosphate kinase [Thermoleophilia bacterium]HQG03545.1 nucleoside-diphosphate kinase [Thermoleophilia bacterium]HQG54682.1 nucleoside-diphosphate kinase [Thermoleophilia bacterium]HQJ98063.1 nucleoside-diphosphate kinase [Thermoleophilia bacterium]
MERTFVMVKPNGVERGLVGEIVARFERRGFRLAGLKALRIDRALAERHYAEHAGKPFFESLVSFITSGPVVAMVWEGREAVRVARTMMGVTDSADAAPGTIRGDFSLSKEENVVHGSDSPDSAAREIALFFAGDELL